MSWAKVAFTEIFADKTGGNIKTLKSDYLSEGNYPIVDQGQKLVGGYTNDRSRLCKSEGPVIIFGDHTRSLKYIDFPFCLGADGTKVLKLKIEADPRYLFYALGAIDIPNAGYSRHFKFLKEARIPFPPLDEQKRIAAILDQADAVCRLRTRAIERLNTLGQSIFYEMFVKGASEEWPTVTVDDVSLNMRTGPFGSQLLHSEFVDEGVPVLGIDNAVSNEFIWAKDRFITDVKYKELARYTVKPRDVLITIMGTCGRCAIVPDDIPTAINTKHLCCITVNQDLIIPQYLHAAFLMHPDVLKQLGIEAKGAVMPGLNMGIIKALKINLPPLELQSQFAGKALKIKTSNSTSSKHQDKLADMFTSLQQLTFRWDL